MQYFTTRQVEQFSGVRQATLRMWEKRYGLTSCLPRAGAIRRYTIPELAYLLDLVLLQKNGIRISRLAALDAAGLQAAVARLDTTEQQLGRALNGLIVAMYSTNIEEFERILDEMIGRYGHGVAMEELIFPFLNTVRLLSYRDQRAEVHFVVTAIRKKIIHAIESLKNPPHGVTSLLFLPEKEHYDLMLLYMNYQFKAAQWTVFYLGTDINTENLMRILEQKKPDYVVTYLASTGKLPVAAYGRWLKKHLPGTTLLITQENEDLPHAGLSPSIAYLSVKEVKTFLLSHSH